jgi:hypothetical protein
MSDPGAELQSSLRNLSIGEKGPVQDIVRPAVKVASTTTPTSAPKPRKPTKKPIADSWEDEDTSDDEPASQGDAAPSPSILSPTLSAEGPLDPPPTPISPQTTNPWVDTGRSGSPAAGKRDPNRRPEKQTAVAGRLIAGALGIRAPKRTEEQRAYDRSVKEQEIKRRNREREEQAKAKEDEERLKSSVWTE